MRVVGIVLVRDEDRFVARALRNVVEFCDELIVVDNESRDGTAAEIERVRVGFPDKVRVVRTRDTGESHALIRPFAGTKTWIFGVDGDEIYDPAGLARLRVRLEQGEFDRWWVVFGNVLNVKTLAPDFSTATGHLAPPCRSMTKLYNFAAIDNWSGRIVERLHGGEVAFREGFDETLRLGLHETLSWEASDFRCLHLCFLSRSSLDPENAPPRRNIMDRHSRSIAKVWNRTVAAITGQRARDWKDEKYARGPRVEKPVGEFFSTPIDTIP